MDATAGRLLRRIGSLLLMVTCHFSVAIAQEAADQDEPPNGLTFDSKPHWYAFDSQSGVLAVTALADRNISLFDAEDFGPGVRPEPKHIPVNGQPISVITRQLDQRSVFVAAMAAPPSLLIMDTDGTILKRYRLEDTPPQLFSSSNKADPYVYWQAKELVQFDLRKLIITSEPRADGTLLNVAPDGSFIYITTQHNRLQFTKRDLNAPSPPSRDVKTVPLGGPVFVANPQTGTVVSGNVLYSPDLATVIATYGFKPQQMFVDQPLIAGYREHNLCVASTNTNAIVAEYPLPNRWFQTPKTRELRPEPLVFPDSTRGRVIIALQRALLSVQLSELKLTVEPSLSPSVPLPDMVALGQTLELDVPFSNPGPKELSLKDAPAGMTISGRKIRWTPTSEQVGDHQLELVAKADSVTTATKWRVNVRLPSITVPLKPQGLDVTDDESRAVVWGDGDIHGANAKLVVVDLRTGALLEKSFKDNPILSAAIEEAGVFVLRTSGVEQLKLPDFDVIASAPFEASVQLPGPLRVVSPKRVMVGDRRYDLPGLTAAPEFKHDIHQGNAWLTGSTAFGKMFEGILWNKDLSAPRMLIWPAMLYRYGPQSNQWLNSKGKQFSVFADAWYPCQPMNKGTSIYDKDQRKGIGGISSPYTFFTIEDRDSRAIQLVPTNQSTGEKENPTALRIENRTNDQPRLFCGRGSFHLLNGQDLISGSLAQWNSRPLPFHIEPTQSEFFLNAEKPVRIKYLAEGATNYRLELILRHDFPRTVLESKTGEFDLQIPTDHQAAIDGHAMLVFNLEQSDKKCEGRLAEYVKPIEGWYKEVFGRSSNGKFPLPVTVMVTAEHPEHGETTLIHSYIFEVTPESVLESMEKTYPFAK